MKQTMPQEIEVWYLIPALRRELAKIFVEEKKLSQKKAAEILGMTNAAVSQYLSSKRGSEVDFSKKDKEMIKDAADEVIKNPEALVKRLYDLCVALRKTKAICEIHRNQDKSVSKDCDVCFK